MGTEPQSGYTDQDRPRSTSPSSSELSLVPYALVDGAWSLPERFVLAFGARMLEEGTLRRVFYDGSVVTPHGFLAVMQRPTNFPVFFFGGTQPLGVAWLNGVNSGVAFAHFCGLRVASGRSVEIGRGALDYWFGAFASLHVLMGTIPANNRRALRFVRHLGFRVLGEVPGMLYDATEGKRVPGVISYYAQ